jgi:signal transduction histidine kinase
MNISHPAIAWVLLGLPAGFVLMGLGLFIVRMNRVRQTQREEPGDILLGAVSHSLRERGELAASLGELRTVHERILDAMPFGVLWVDHRHVVAALNAEGRRLLNVKPGVIGLEAGFVLEPFPWMLEGLGKAPGPAWRFEAGERIWRLRRIEAPDKVGALLEFEDITIQEQDTRRTQLRERFAELGEMTAGVAHQLKNGLAVLKGQGQLLQRAGHLEVAQEVLEETESLERLVQRFLQWAKPLNPECVRLRLEDAAEQAAAEVRKRPMALARNLVVEGRGTAMADPLLLHQALVNLLENACQASGAGGEVLVRVANDCLEVLDDGPGLGEETLIRMLRPFESGRPDGTGLGLPLALKWLNAQGADLKIGRRGERGTRAAIQW